MSIRKRFNEIFNIEDTVEEEKRRFVERINQLIFHVIDTTEIRTFKYETLFDMICFELGVNVTYLERHSPRDD